MRGTSALALFVLGLWAAPAHAQWTAQLEGTSGGLGEADLRGPLEAASAAYATCAEGAGPYRFVFELSVQTTGRVREASYARGAEDPMAPARSSRCIRHALLEVAFPRASAATTATLVLALGGRGASAPSTSPSSSTSPSTSPSTSTSTSTSPSTSTSTSTSPSPSSSPTPTPAPTPTPTPTPAPSSSPTPHASAISLGAALADGRDAASLMSVVDAHRADLEACFATGVASHPGLSGDVRLHLGIDAGGHVTRSMLQGSEALAVALAGCVGATARAWSFPAGTEAALTVPIHFGAR